MGCDGVKMLKDFVLVLVSSVCSKCQRFNQKKVDNTAWPCLRKSVCPERASAGRTREVAGGAQLQT